MRSHATKQAREQWGIITADTLKGRSYEQVRLTYRGYFCRKQPRAPHPDFLQSRTGYRPTDLDNLVGAMKSALDGAIDAGLVEDDSRECVRFGDHEIAWVDTFDEERVEIQVEPLGGKG